MGSSLTARYFDFVDQSVYYLTSEMLYLKNQGGKKYRIVDGRRVETGTDQIVYTFETDTELHFPDDTPVKVFIGEEKYDGFVIGCEGFSVMLSLGKDMGDEIPSAELAAELWRLLEELCKRLEETKEAPRSIAVTVACRGKELENAEAITQGRERAIERSQTEPVTIVWGPPGTGKTHTLAEIAIGHIKAGKRVLMVSHSNVSVDGAILKVSELLNGSMPEGAILRCGYPRNPELIDHPALTAFNLALSKNPELNKRRKELISERGRLGEHGRQDKRYVEITKELSLIRALLKEREEAFAEKAKMVATTITKATVDKSLYRSEFDVVLFDEASMAYVPQVVFASHLAKTNFCCFGDHRQLPPIVQSERKDVQEWLSRDIFRHTGITDAVESGHGHPWLVMLYLQRRMHPLISNFVSYHMYGNRLRNHPDLEDLLAPVTDSKPFPGHAAGFVDISGMMSVTSKSMDQSHYNILSAFVSVKLALMADLSAEVGIITPYSAQSRLIRAMQRDIASNYETPPKFSCATVHQFQGSEKDIIIFDAVDCYRIAYPGPLLISRENDTANRLMNVAMTRTKGKFVLVANRSYFFNKLSSPNLMLPKMFEYLERVGGKLAGAELLVTFRRSNARHMSVRREDTNIEPYLADIDNAEDEIRIDIPGSLNQAKWNNISSMFLLALEKAKKRGVKVIIRAENKRGLPQELVPLTIENPFVCNPLTVIDKSVIWFGQPPSDANFISSGNKLKTSFRPVFRFTGSITARLLIALTGMDRISDEEMLGACDGDPDEQSASRFSAYVAEHKRCPVCGSPLKLKKGKSFFLGCGKYPGCKYIERVEPDIVNEYLLGSDLKCPRDGTSLEAKLGRYGVYVRCNGMNMDTYKLDEI
jgi:hypothetical protein